MRLPSAFAATIIATVQQMEDGRASSGPETLFLLHRRWLRLVEF